MTAGEVVVATSSGYAAVVGGAGRGATPPSSVAAPRRRPVPRRAPTGGDVVGGQRRHRHRVVRPAGGAGAAPGASPAGVHQVAPSGYRNPTQLPAGGVLVVGASATGVQLADELPRAGRDVVAGRRPPHPAAAPLPGHGHPAGGSSASARFDRTIDEVPDPARARREPSLQLVGRPDAPDARPADAAGRRRAAGRPARRRRRRAVSRSAADLAAHGAGADARLRRVLGRHRRPHRRATGSPPRCSSPTRRRACRPVAVTDQLDLARARHHAPSSGRPATAGRTRGCDVPSSTPPARSASAAASRRCPGLYVLGQRFQHYRNSNFIDGVGRDAAVRRRPPRRPHSPTPDADGTGSWTARRTPSAPTTTSSSSAPAPPARPRRCCSPARACASSSSTAAATAPTRCRPTP